MQQKTKNKIKLLGQIGLELLIISVGTFLLVTFLNRYSDASKGLIHDIGKGIRNIQQEFKNGYNDTTSVDLK